MCIAFRLDQLILVGRHGPWGKQAVESYKSNIIPMIEEYGAQRLRSRQLRLWWIDGGRRTSLQLPHFRVLTFRGKERSFVLVLKLFVLHWS